ncbi:MAG: HlyD family secretion protein [Alphaproteobacteria bacterium]|nr:HlyD family secretion protein [Alphaproteobacteria bacterium]
MQKKQNIIGIILTVILLGYGLFHFINKGHEYTDDAVIEAHVVPVSSRISGYITKLNIKDNQPIKKGDVLVEIDPRDYQLKLDAQRALVASAEVLAKNASVNSRRQQAIGETAGSRREIDNAIASEQSAIAVYNNAKAQLAIAEKDFADSKIIAPDDGIVTMRSAETGAYVTPGKQLFSLVTPERWVVANFKEVQITHMRSGQKVELHIDAYPNLKLTGIVDSIMQGTGARFSAFPPENATGNFVKIVQRVPVKILLNTMPENNEVLGAGLSVTATVSIDENVDKQGSPEPIKTGQQ